MSPDTDDRGVANVTVMRAGAGFRFVYADGTRFWIDLPGDQVWMTWETTFEDACTYLVGPIVAFVLRMRGALALHASAVRAGDRALAFVGPHGAGKSTVAAALGRRGLGVIADDVVRLTREGDDWIAHPFGGMLRLWPDAAAKLFGRAGTLPPITPSWEKRALWLGEHGIAPVSAAVPLGAILFLDAARMNLPVRISVLSPPDALVRLAANSAASHLLDSAQRGREFRDLVSIVRRTPCAVVHRVDAVDPDTLCHALLEWTSREMSTEVV